MNFSRRSFLGSIGLGSLGISGSLGIYFSRAESLLTPNKNATKVASPTPPIPTTPTVSGDSPALPSESDKYLGEAGNETAARSTRQWKQFSDRKLRVGVIGKWGGRFEFHNHPNVIVEAVSELDYTQRAFLTDSCRCSKSYRSLEELIKDPKIEAVFIATDAPSHFRHVTAALEHGKHVACAVPAVFGSVEEAYALKESVKKSGLTYMMFETSLFRKDCYAMRAAYRTGLLGRLIHSEGEYYHYSKEPIPSYKGWRNGPPPQWYPTHSNAYHTCITGTGFTQVSCIGVRSDLSYLQKENNSYRNSFGTETALFRTVDGGTARMVVSWDTPGPEMETGRVRGAKASMTGKDGGSDAIGPGAPPDAELPALPPTMDTGGHGGSHGNLTAEFVEAILTDRDPIVDINMALNLTVPGIVAHESALRDGETLRIPQFT
jgi:predicted dehydrogenase